MATIPPCTSLPLHTHAPITTYITGYHSDGDRDLPCEYDEQRLLSRMRHQQLVTSGHVDEQLIRMRASAVASASAAAAAAAAAAASGVTQASDLSLRSRTSGEPDCQKGEFFK